MKQLKQINFEEAIEHVRRGEKVYATNLSAAKPQISNFSSLTIAAVLNRDYIFQIVEEESKDE